MTLRTRATLILALLTMLLTLMASTSMAGDQFNLLTHEDHNNSFDTMNEHGFVFLDPWWTLKNKSGDKIDCSGETVAAFSGDCSFRFKGTEAESSKLKQVLAGEDLEVLNAFVDDADVTLQVAYMVNSLSDKTVLKAKAIATLDDGTKVKTFADFSGTTMIGEFTSWESVDGTSVTIPKNSIVSKVKVVIGNKSGKGSKAFIDNVEVLFASNAS